jgi:hypothetical protein
MLTIDTISNYFSHCSPLIVCRADARDEGRLSLQIRSARYDGSPAPDRLFERPSFCRCLGKPARQNTVRLSLWRRQTGAQCIIHRPFNNHRSSGATADQTPHLAMDLGPSISHLIGYDVFWAASRRYQLPPECCF